MLLKKINFTINQLIGNDFYVGYYINTWNPMINYFLLGKYKKINIFNLNFTYTLLKISFNIITSILIKKGKLWVVNEKFIFFDKFLEFLKLKKKYKSLLFFNKKWPKGLLSNHRYVIYIKRNRFPHVIFSSDVDKNKYVINESFILGIPTIGIVDSKDHPRNILYPIAGNSKSLKSIYFMYLLLFKNVYFSANLRRKKFRKKFIKKYKSIIKNFKFNDFETSLDFDAYINFRNFISWKLFKYFYKNYLDIFVTNELNKYTLYKKKRMRLTLDSANLLEKYTKAFLKFRKTLKRKKKLKKYNIYVYVRNRINLLVFLNASVIKIENMVKILNNSFKSKVNWKYIIKLYLSKLLLYIYNK